MKHIILILIVLMFGFSLTGCGPIQKVGNPIGAGIGNVSDELGAERKVGKGNDTLTIHPEGDKKIKLDF